MTLKLKEIDVDCILGELPKERVKTQRILVDVSLEISDLAGETDELDDTVDYAALTKAIRTTLTTAECRMIERAAKLVVETCLRFGRGKVFAATAAVTKTGAIPHLKSATVVAEGNAE